MKRSVKGKKCLLWELFIKKKRIDCKHVFISSTKRSDHSNTRLAIQIEKDAGMAWEFVCLAWFTKCDVFTLVRLCWESWRGAKSLNVVCTNQSTLNIAEHKFESCDLMSKFTAQLCVADQTESCWAANCLVNHNIGVCLEYASGTLARLRGQLWAGKSFGKKAAS